MATCLAVSPQTFTQLCTWIGLTQLRPSCLHWEQAVISPCLTVEGPTVKSLSAFRVWVQEQLGEEAP